MKTNNDELLRVKNLKKFFETRSGTLHAVDDVSFSVQRGEIFGVVGESGCGKSTLGRVILRLHEPTSGEVIFNGENIFNFPTAKVKQLRKQMQIIFQDPYASLNPRMTIGQALSEPLIIQGIYSTNQHAELEKRVRRC